MSVPEKIGAIPMLIALTFPKDTGVSVVMDMLGMERGVEVCS